MPLSKKQKENPPLIKRTQSDGEEERAHIRSARNVRHMFRSPSNPSLPTASTLSSPPTSSSTTEMTPRELTRTATSVVAAERILSQAPPWRRSVDFFTEPGSSQSSGVVAVDLVSENGRAGEQKSGTVTNPNVARRGPAWLQQATSIDTSVKNRVNGVRDDARRPGFRFPWQNSQQRQDTSGDDTQPSLQNPSNNTTVGIASEKNGMEGEESGPAATRLPTEHKVFAPRQQQPSSISAFLDDTGENKSSTGRGDGATGEDDQGPGVRALAVDVLEQAVSNKTRRRRVPHPVDPQQQADSNRSKAAQQLSVSATSDCSDIEGASLKEEDKTNVQTKREHAGDSALEDGYSDEIIMPLETSPLLGELSSTYGSTEEVMIPARDMLRIVMPEDMERIEEVKLNPLRAMVSPNDSGKDEASALTPIGRARIWEKILEQSRPLIKSLMYIVEENETTLDSGIILPCAPSDDEKVWRNLSDSAIARGLSGSCSLIAARPWERVRGAVQALSKIDEPCQADVDYFHVEHE